MLLVPFDLLCSGVLKRSAQAFSTPALRKVREGRGTRCLGDASEVKSLGHPPPPDQRSIALTIRRD